MSELSKSNIDKLRKKAAKWPFSSPVMVAEKQAFCQTLEDIFLFRKEGRWRGKNYNPGGLSYNYF